MMWMCRRRSRLGRWVSSSWSIEMLWAFWSWTPLALGQEIQTYGSSWYRSHWGSRLRRPWRCRKGRGQHRLCDLRIGGPPPRVSLLQGVLWISAFLFLPFLIHRIQHRISFYSAQGAVSGDSELKLGQWAVWGSANLPQLHLPTDNTEAGVIHLSPSWSSLSGRTYFRRCINWSEQWREVEVV